MNKVITKSKRFIAIILCIITFITNLSTSVFAWTSTEGVNASSIDGPDFVGYDGDKYYYHRRLTHLLYDDDGNVIEHYSFTRTRPLDKLILKVR